MRAVHFHPHGLPVVLTAEVQDPSPTPDLSMSLSEGGAYSRLAGAAQQQARGGRAAASGQGGGGVCSRAANQPPPSQEVPFPSPQLLRGASPGATPGAPGPATSGRAGTPGFDPRIFVPTSEGPVPAGPGELQRGAFAQPQPGHALSPSIHLPQARWRSPFGPVGSRGQRGDAQLAQPSGAAAASLWAAQPQQQHRQAHEPPAGEQPAAARSTGWVPPGSAELPPSMVPLGWELPFPSNLREPFAPSGAGGCWPRFAGGPGREAALGGEAAVLSSIVSSLDDSCQLAPPPIPELNSVTCNAPVAGDALQQEPWPGQQGPGNPASLPHVMAAFSAAAWNIIGEEQPPRVRLRLWRWVAGARAGGLLLNLLGVWDSAWKGYQLKHAACLALLHTLPCEAHVPSPPPHTTQSFSLPLCAAGLTSPSPRPRWRAATTYGCRSRMLCCAPRWACTSAPAAASWRPPPRAARPCRKQVGVVVVVCVRWW